MICFWIHLYPKLVQITFLWVFTGITWLYHYVTSTCQVSYIKLVFYSSYGHWTHLYPLDRRKHVYHLKLHNTKLYISELVQWMEVVPLLIGRKFIYLNHHPYHVQLFDLVSSHYDHNQKWSKIAIFGHYFMNVSIYEYYK